MWLGEGSGDAVLSKMKEARARVNKLQQEADDLQKQMKALVLGGVGGE